MRVTKTSVFYNFRNLTMDYEMNNSTSLNPEFFAEKFELNDDL